MEKNNFMQNDNRNEKNGMQTGNTDKNTATGTSQNMQQDKNYGTGCKSGSQTGTQSPCGQKNAQSGSQYGQKEQQHTTTGNASGASSMQHGMQQNQNGRYGSQNDTDRNGIRNQHDSQYGRENNDSETGSSATTATSSSITRRTSKRIPASANTNGSSFRELSFFRAAPRHVLRHPAAETRTLRHGSANSDSGQPPSGDRPPQAREASRRQRSAAPCFRSRSYTPRSNTGVAQRPTVNAASRCSRRSRYTAPAKSPAPMASEERAERSVPLRFAAAAALREVCFVMAESFSNAENGARTAPHARRRPPEAFPEEIKDGGVRSPFGGPSRRRQPRSAPETPPDGDRG
jgi:hypothetical protein